MSGRWATQATRAMRIDGFTGRTTELIELSDLLSHADTRIVLVQGMGGMGKTWLARKYVESTDGVYAQQAWCSLVHDPDPANCVRQLLSQLQAAPDPSLDVYALVDVLAERLTTRTLIVLDNFETFDAGVVRPDVEPSRKPRARWSAAAQMASPTRWKPNIE